MKKVLGKVDEKIAKKYNLEEHINKPIVLYDNDRRHCINRHKNDFNSPKIFYYILSHLDDIINYPDEVFYKKSTESLEYYKTYEQGVSVRVKIENGNELKVKTFFKVTQTKIENRKEKEQYNKYVINK